MLRADKLFVMTSAMATTVFTMMVAAPVISAVITTMASVSAFQNMHIK